MTSDTIADLHDRLTRGESLSEEEYQAVQAWYAEQDQLERSLINRQQSSDVIAQLQQEISQTAHQLEIITQQMTTTISANTALRQEISRLQARLAQLAPGRAA